MEYQKVKKYSKQIMSGFILILSILLQFTCCNPEQSKPIQVKESSQAGKKDASLQLKFTSGIRSIFQDSKGNYWLGSHQEGLCLFDGKSFEYFTIKEGLSNNQIHSIQEDTNGNIWFGTADGVCSYNGIIIRNHTLRVNYDLPGEWIKTDHDLWFNAGNREGVYRYDGKKLNYLAFPKPKVVNPDNVYAVTSFSEGKNDMLWIATYAGVFGYNGNQFTLINDETLGLKKETGQLHIRSILEDSKGRLWIGNNGTGVLLKENNSTINFSEKHHLIHPTSSRGGDKSPAGTLEHVFAIEEDGDGNIWFGDRDTGVWKYDGNTMSNYTKKEGLTDDFVLTIYKDNNEELWLGLADGNVLKFNGKTFVKQF